VNIAVFIDFDNIEIGVKTTLNEHFDVGVVLDAIKERGEIVTKIAYADWTRAGEYSRALTQHAIRLVQRNLTPGGDKNGADINLALDALEMAFTHPHINAYVIVSGDSDFLSLVEKLKQYDKKVFVLGGRAFTSVILQRNCHEFIAYENLIGGRRSSSRGGRPTAATSPSPIEQAFPIVKRALKILADREVSPQTGLLKSTLLQLDSTFSERSYGASSFLDFAEKLAQAGLVQLKHAGRSVMVELNTTNAGLEDSGATMAPASASPGPAASDEVRPAVEPPESAAEGVRVAGAILMTATNARWPMYLRNVKQTLRAADRGFDERRYGFGGLMDLLRALQRESYVRLERDRRGGLRAFPGQKLDRARVPQAAEAAVEQSVAAAPVDAAVSETIETTEIVEAEAVEVPATPVDTTAELLGTKPRRSRAPGSTGGRTKDPLRGARKTAAGQGSSTGSGSRRPSSRRASTRSKKPAAAADVEPKDS
jgi:uncharacterized LabA/DUF88 family protein